jgi:uncharacterized protein YecT (DUF1311 family)
MRYGFCVVFAAVVALVIGIGGAGAEAKLDARDVKRIEDCIKSQAGSGKSDSCIGTLADPCLECPDGQSTFGMADCYRREQAIWDDILNEGYRRLRADLNPKQNAKLRDVQRAWIASRDATCGFYSDFHEGGSMAIPAGAACMNQETARRAIYLLNFLQ